MNTEKNIQKISLIFFFIIGISHILAHLMILNGYLVDAANAVKTILEIPFILVAAVYGFVSIKIGFELPEKKHRISNLIFIFFVIVLFVFLLYINLFVPDRIS